MASKPIRVFWSPLDQQFYASRQYRDNHDGTVYGDKFNVTQDIARIIVEEEVTFSSYADGKEEEGDG